MWIPPFIKVTGKHDDRHAHETAEIISFKRNNELRHYIQGVYHNTHLHAPTQQDGFVGRVAILYLVYMNTL